MQRKIPLISLMVPALVNIPENSRLPPAPTSTPLVATVPLVLVPKRPETQTNCPAMLPFNARTAPFNRLVPGPVMTPSTS